MRLSAAVMILMSLCTTACSEGPAAEVPNAKAAGYGVAPEFTGIDRWLNSEPLTLASLRGKVVLVEFWTYTCSNCLRTLPHVNAWYERYKDQGLVIVGVHTPETDAEHDSNSVRAAIARHGIKFPVAQDNAYATWSAYRNKYWPASYLIDRDGTIVRKHIGEGEYAETESAIQTLLSRSARTEGAITH